MKTEHELIIVGGGPAGLSAAITAASEGLGLCLLEAGPSLGGQARESMAIENYPGHLHTTGSELMQTLISQAMKFNATLHPLARVQRLNVDGDWKLFVGDNGDVWKAHSAILAMGVSYRRFQAEGINPFLGRGVHYGLASGFKPPKPRCNLIVVGGANSAGQAAVYLAMTAPNAAIKLVIRRTIGAGMSHYLIQRLNALPNVEVLEHSEVIAVEGDAILRCVHIRGPNGTTKLDCATLHIFIGAEPKTAWLNGDLELDPKGFVRTDHFETSIPGVFAAGDIRLGSVKRVASAVGEGAATISEVHKYLEDILV